MEFTNIPPVKRPSTVLRRGERRDMRLAQAMQARRRLDSPSPSGRAWINGREVGGADPRYVHLGRTYD